MIDFQISDYRPSESEEYMCPKHREYFKRKLLAWRESLVAMSTVFLVELKENENKAADIIDQSALQAEMFLDFTTRERQQKILHDIEQALTRIESGEYGYCEITDEEIGLKRLEAQPLARRCIEAQKQFERFENSRRQTPFLQNRLATFFD